jgi:MarR family transcriptional regulator, organic hydroperoxide resistance regulator
MKPQRRGGFLLAKVHQHGGRIFARMLRQRGIQLNPGQGRIMFALWQFGSMPIQELATRTSLTKSTLTSMLDGLERLGHLRRVRDGDDRRKIIIELTASNRSLHALFDEVSAEMTALFYDGFADAEIDLFEQNLQRILDNLKQHDLPDAEPDRDAK